MEGDKCVQNYDVDTNWRRYFKSGAEDEGNAEKGHLVNAVLSVHVSDAFHKKDKADSERRFTENGAKSRFSTLLLHLSTYTLHLYPPKFGNSLATLT